MDSKGFEIDSDIIASRNNDGSIVAMKVDDSDLFYKITGVATEVWTYLEQGLKQTEIIEKISSDFEISKEEASKDIQTFLKDLIKFNIITEM